MKLNVVKDGKILEMTGHAILREWFATGEFPCAIPTKVADWVVIYLCDSLPEEWSVSAEKLYTLDFWSDVEKWFSVMGCKSYIDCRTDGKFEIPRLVELKAAGKGIERRIPYREPKGGDYIMTADYTVYIIRN